MQYVEIETGAWNDAPLPWWVSLLKRVIPAANPDFENDYYPRTRTWWIELDDRGVPQREIGFDENAVPIVLGPVGQNYGFAVDNSSPWPEPRPVSAEAAAKFQTTWDLLWPKYQHLEAN